MKKEYTSPELEITLFEEKDIVTISDPNGKDNFGDLNELL